MRRAHFASAARGSIAFGISRCWTIRSLTTTSAFLNAASTSPPATVQWNAWLLGTSACSCGAPGFTACSGSVTRRQRLVVDLDQLERVVGRRSASRRRRPPRCRRRSGRCPWPTHGYVATLRLAFGTSQAHGVGCNALDVGAGEHRHDAGRCLRAAGIDPLDARVRMRAAQHRRMHHARQRRSRRCRWPRR